MDIASLLEPCLGIAHRAGEEILEIYLESRQFKVRAKTDHSPLTQADLLSNEVICDALKKITPEIPILSEENPAPSFNKRQSWDYYWCIDPLDGTREFIRHSGEFTVNIALIHQHSPVLGIIYVPVLEEYYFAVAGKPAYKRDNKGSDKRITVRKWRPDNTVILTSKGAREEDLRKRVAHFLLNYELRKTSSAWKFGLIAEGKADVYPRLGDTYEWDTAAGQCILEQAGGMIIDSNQRALRYNTKETLLNSHFIALGDYQGLLQYMHVKEVLAEETN